MNKKRIATVLGTIGVAAAATVALAPAANASASGSNGYAGITVVGSGLYVDYIDATSAIDVPEFYGHFQITANGVTLANSATGWYPQFSGVRLNEYRNFANNTQICVTAWKYNGSSYYGVGRACETVHS